MHVKTRKEPVAAHFHCSNSHEPNHCHKQSCSKSNQWVSAAQMKRQSGWWGLEPLVAVVRGGGLINIAQPFVHSMHPLNRFQLLGVLDACHGFGRGPFSALLQWGHSLICIHGLKIAAEHLLRWSHLKIMTCFCLSCFTNDLCIPVNMHGQLRLVRGVFTAWSVIHTYRWNGKLCSYADVDFWEFKLEIWRILSNFWIAELLIWTALSFDFRVDVVASIDG